MTTNGVNIPESVTKAFTVIYDAILKETMKQRKLHALFLYQ